MCWSEDISWLTFFIGLTSSFNVSWIFYKKGNKVIPALTFAWMPVIFMQFFEALIWRSIDDPESSQWYGRIGSYGAVFTALLQPPLMGIILMTQDNVSSLRRRLSSLLVIIHIYWYSYSLTKISPIENLTVYDDVTCRHVDFTYWEDLPYSPDFMYAYTVSSIFLLLLPLDLALFMIGASGTTYLGSYLLYNCGESNGSLWCWSSALMPIFYSLYWENFH